MIRSTSIFLRVFSIALVFGTTTAGAQLGYRMEDYPPCHQQSTADITRCMEDQARQWDERLNFAYGDLRGQGTRKEKAALQKAQRAWIRFRDANCNYYWIQPGSISRIMAAACLRRMTAERAVEMESMQSSRRRHQRRR